ncbi:hypothetical protein LV82_02041 [Albidovulum inexpectatum]|uniref:Uncharacterized protein n=1 Tax=Albidovulum inexpectatum TaxID=196587 RepID=A0A2S5JFG6_9RHOB|nr:hypothetical protein [Albidovulum inexpectatum]PPB80169.1 hypothetical protein LV82_02041 [Albidovulum inexpectatum]
MTISADLIDRLSTEAGRRLTARARRGRIKALAQISRICVTYTRDGQTRAEEMFDTTPTLGDLYERIGPDAYIVSITMRRRSLRERLRLALLAA